MTKRWVKARYVAELDEIRARYSEFEVIGPPEVREVTGRSEIQRPMDEG